MLEIGDAVLIGTNVGIVASIVDGKALCTCDDRVKRYAEEYTFIAKGTSMLKMLERNIRNV